MAAAFLTCLLLQVAFSTNEERIQPDSLPYRSARRLLAGHFAVKYNELNWMTILLFFIRKFVVSYCELMKTVYLKPTQKIVFIAPKVILCFSRVQDGHTESTSDHENDL